MEAKEVIEYLGYDPKEIENIDKFKEKFDPDYIKKSEALKDDSIIKAVQGKYNGTIVTALKASARDAGIEFEDGEIKGKETVEVAKIAFSKAANKIKDLESKAGAGSEDLIKEWKEKVTKLESKYNDTKKSLDTTATEFETFKGSVEQEKKNYKKTSEFERAVSSVKWKNGISDIEKEGFITVFNKNYGIDLDDEGKVYVGSFKDGKLERIKNPKKANEWKSIEEVLTDFAIEKGVYAVAQGAAGDPLKKLQQKPGAGVQSQSPQRAAHPRALGII